MGRSGSCILCSDPRRLDIETRFDAGETGRGLARVTGLTEPTIRRHMKRCRTTPTLPSAKEAGVSARSTAGTPPPDVPFVDVLQLPEGVEPTPMIMFLREHLGSLKALYDASRAADPRNAPQLSAQVNRTALMLNKLTSEQGVPKNPTERLSENPEWAEAQRVLIRALAPFPEARLAVIDGLRKWIAIPEEAN